MQMPSPKEKCTAMFIAAHFLKDHTGEKRNVLTVRWMSHCCSHTWSAMQQWEWKPAAPPLNVNESCKCDIEQAQPGIATKKYIGHNFISVHFKIRQNYSLVFEVRAIVTSKEISCNKKYEGSCKGLVSLSLVWLQEWVDFEYSSPELLLFVHFLYICYT